MKNNKLADLSMDLAVEIIELVKQLKSKKESIISRQVGRSGTSIGANIRESQYAHSKADFIAKLQIALKEANETGYWLELLLKTNYISKEYYNKIDKLCSTIRVLLITSINTTKRNMESKK
ncbi:four helix bundle protein [Clostridium sp. 'deep sea']|uniref:four helix bundle protein n=1 Tax=Clostridium sp. 'deep sea' TaxID=2779445 RepID=UPI001896581E|nr:four helix bundle protein [Clostridium sp. 'deep sea']QOR33614.1 four helix bundle protein [Clostridium sp. 'deep sea']